MWEVANELAGVAATLIGCKAVRLYQDCAFLKVALSSIYFKPPMTSSENIMLRSLNHQ